jgi:hypothetical protein
MKILNLSINLCFTLLFTVSFNCNCSITENKFSTGNILQKIFLGTLAGLITYNTSINFLAFCKGKVNEKQEKENKTQEAVNFFKRRENITKNKIEKYFILTDLIFTTSLFEYFIRGKNAISYNLPDGFKHTSIISYPLFRYFLIEKITDLMYSDEIGQKN